MTTPVARQAYWEDFFQSPDPWNYGSSYEQLKYKRTLALLPGRPISRALELACAEGHFTEHLACRTDRLVAADISTRALERARARCAGRTNIEFRQLDLVSDALPGAFDLIVCSEVLYYLADVDELRDVGGKLRDALVPGGCLLAAHPFLLKDDLGRTGFDWENPFGAEVISRVLTELSGLVLERSLVTELYRIDRFRRAGQGVGVGEAVIEVVPIGSSLDPEVERFVVWGGAEARRIEVRQSERTERLPVLLYHRVAETGPSELAPYRVNRANFIAQMRLLRRRGYHSVTSGDVEEHLKSRRPFVGRPVMITFDDGYLDFREIAWPILQACDFSAEVFISTEIVEGQADGDAVFGPSGQLMTWADILALRREGVRFGSNLSSQILAYGLPGRELTTAAAGSRAVLEARLGEPIHSAAAPLDIFDEPWKGVLASCGYKVGFSTRSGSASLDDNPLNLPRIAVYPDWDAETFLKHLDFAGNVVTGGGR